MLPPQGTAASAQQESAYRAYLQAHEAIDSMNSPGLIPWSTPELLMPTAAYSAACSNHMLLHPAPSFTPLASLYVPQEASLSAWMPMGLPAGHGSMLLDTTPVPLPSLHASPCAEPLRRVHGGPAEGIKPAQAQQAPDSLGSTGTLEVSCACATCCSMHESPPCLVLQDSDDEPISDVEFTPAAKAVTRRRRHVVGRSASTRRRRKAAAGAGTRAKALSAQARANRPKKAGEFSSTYKGVTKHKDTGKYEAHLWDNKVIRTGQLDANGRRKGKQVYLGSFKCEKLAARVYDIAARVFLGPNTFLNVGAFCFDHLTSAASLACTRLHFDAADYEDINKELAGISKHDLAVLLKKNCHTFTWPCKLQDLDA
eukprot:jgi/Astpho2/6765/Aster-07211